MRLSASIQHVRQIAVQGLAPGVAIPAMVDAIEHVVPTRMQTFVWLDKHGMTRAIYEREPIPEALDAFNSQTPELVRRGEPSVVDLARGDAEFGGWRRFLAHPMWHRSVMKNELFRPYGIGNNLDFPIRINGRTVALLALCREPGSRRFSRAEVDAVLALRPYFAHAMAAPDALQDSCEPSGGSVFLFIAGDGTVLDPGPRACLLLYQLGETENRFGRFETRTAPPAIARVIRRFDSAGSGRNERPPSDFVDTRWGRIGIVVHGRARSGEYAVTLQKFEPRVLRRLERVRQLDLSPRERELALAMCGTQSGEAIAAGAGLTVGSFRQSAKRIYRRVGVEGREGLVELIDR